MSGQKFYITTPIYYVNGAPHLGHAYTSVAADVMARFKRLEGYDVFFLTGTDEHGQKVAAAARAAGVDPQAFTDGVAADFIDMARRMQISNDDFIRTTEPRHKAAAQAIWRRLEQAGAIYLGKYEGWYSVRDEAFYDEEELVTALDGTKLAPTGAPVEWVIEPSYFFKLSEFQDRLLAFYEKNPGFIAPQAKRNEILSFVRGGLNDLSISRTSFTWGIPVPGDEKHVMYVWLDALVNYLTAAGYPDENAENTYLLAGQSAFGGQRDHPLPCGVLAGVFDGRGSGFTRAGVQPWLVDRGRRKDEQIHGQFYRCAAAGGGIRARPGAVFSVARSAVRQ